MQNSQLQTKRIKHDVDGYGQTASSILALKQSKLDAVTAEAGSRFHGITVTGNLGRSLQYLLFRVSDAVFLTTTT